MKWIIEFTDAIVILSHSDDIRYRFIQTAEHKKMRSKNFLQKHIKKLLKRKIN